MHNHFLPAAHWKFLTPYYEMMAWTFARRIWSDVRKEVIRRAPSDATVADLGCGPGTILRNLSAARPDLILHGIDVDPSIVDIARQKSASASITFQVSSIANIPFPNGSVDIVVSTLMFHHLPPNVQSEAFQEIKRILKPEGVFLLCDFSMPSKRWFSPIVGFFLRVEATAPLQIRGRLFTLAKESNASIETLSSYFGCISLHLIRFPKS